MVDTLLAISYKAPLLITSIGLLMGFYALIKGSDCLINGSESIAKSFSISPFVIGFSVLAIGTSLPEMMVTVLAALNHEPGIVFGNIIGSNISNTLLIVGISVIIGSISFAKPELRKQVLLTTAASIFFIFLIYLPSLSSPSQPSLQRWSGIVLLLLFGVYLWYLMTAKAVSVEEEEYPSYPMFKAILYCIIGIIGLGIGGQLVVSNTLAICSLLSIATTTVSLIVVALGTSLPELVTCIDALRRGKGDLAIGNILGSNIFNLYLVLGVSASIIPISLPKELPLYLGIMITSMVMITGMIYANKKNSLGRGSGIILLGCYLLYLASLIL